MAVAVDISGSKCMSYSPLNEKHNILYSGVRQSFIQRYKQKPWFRLNPFTDKGFEKGESIEVYDPECDAGLPLLQSLVIVEEHFSDIPQLTQEFNISEFWDFLFSDSWSNGHSVRVFEGQLLDMMITCLFSLTRAGKVVQHVTQAYAKNTRQKYSMVKKETKKEPELVPFIETLLLKFVYFGHVVKPACFDPESSVGYPDITTATNSSWVPETVELDSLGTDATISKTDLKSLGSKLPSPPLSDSLSLIQHPRKRRVRNPNEVQAQIEKERTLISRFISHNDSIIPAPPPIPRDQNYRYTCSNFSNASDDYKSLPPRVDLKNFICTEKVTYIGEFTLPDDSSSSSASEDEDDNVDNNFGQQYYLGDLRNQTREDVFESAETKLKKRKEIVQRTRDEKKEKVTELKQPKPKIMPEFSELDIQKYVKEHEILNVTGALESDTVPTLEEYAAILEVDQKRDEKSRIKRMASTLTKKSVINKQSILRTGKLEKRVSQAGFNFGASCKVKSPAQRMALLEKMLKVKKKKPVVKRTNVIEVPIVYVSTPSGRSFLHPISRELMLTRKTKEAEKRRKEFPPTSTKRRMSLLPTVGTALSNELQKLRQASKANLSEGKENTLSLKFPKVKLIPSYASIESLDEEDADDECDELEQDAFDAKKLNIKYSRDRLRKAKAAKRKEEKNKKGHVYDVLKKYCRMQSILKALSAPAKKQRRSSISGLPTKSRRKKKTNEVNIFKGIEIKESDEYANVGKMKKFAFLEVKEKTNVKSNQSMKSLFENHPMELFFENLERALKEFVVRKELVVSDYNGKSLVSITFTKKSVFTLSKYSNNQ